MAKEGGDIHIATYIVYQKLLIIMENIEMWLLLLISFGLVICFFVILIFGLVKAGRRADEGEEKILKIISFEQQDDITADIVL